jgi:type I restriction enzyme, S subunit
MNTSLSPWSIPGSWTWVPIGEVANVVGGGTPRTSDALNFDGGTVPWVTPADLSGYSEKYIGRGSRNITTTGLNTSGARLLPNGTVLFSSRAPIGYVAIASNPLATNQGFKSFVLPPGLEPEYVYYYLQRAKELALDLASGTTFREISGRQAAKIPLAIAPVGEQQRVVSAIESYFTRLDDAVATLERVQRNLKRYRASVLKAAVEGRLVPTEAELARTEGRSYEPAPVLLERILAERRRCWEETELAKMNAKRKPPKDHKWKAKYKEPVAPDTSELPELPEGWCWASVDQMCSHIVDCPHSTPKWAKDGYICVRTTEFLPGRLVLDRVRFVSRSIFEERIQRLRPEAGDILYSREGGILGIACQVPPGVELCLGQRMMLMRVGTQRGARYLMHTLNGPMLLSRVRELTGGSASPHLNVSDIKNFPVPLPPEAELVRIADTIDDVLSIADSTNADVGVNLARLVRLYQSILKWAFEGRLVDQDPTDEPAARLLQRIRAERASATDNPPRSPRRAKARTPKS